MNENLNECNVNKAIVIVCTSAGITKTKNHVRDIMTVKDDDLSIVVLDTLSTLNQSLCDRMDECLESYRPIDYTDIVTTNKYNRKHTKPTYHKKNYWD